MLEKVITSAVVVIIVGAGLYVGYEHVKDLGRAEVQAEWNADKERQDKAAKAAIAKREAENIQVAAAQAETVKLIKKERQMKKHVAMLLMPLLLVACAATPEVKVVDLPEPPKPKIPASLIRTLPEPGYFQTQGCKIYSLVCDTQTK